MCTSHLETRNTSSMNRHNQSSTFFAGAVLGAVAGAVAALLLAPQSGRETRQQIKRNAQQARVRGNLLLKEGEDLVDDAKEKLQDTKDKVRHTGYVAKERLQHMRGNTE